MAEFNLNEVLDGIARKLAKLPNKNTFALGQITVHACERIVDFLCGQIEKGVDAGGVTRKPNTPRWADFKQKKGRGTTPLINTGLLHKRAYWRIVHDKGLNFRVEPPKERSKFVYGYARGKGYPHIMGMDSDDHAWEEEISELLAEELDEVLRA